MPWKFEQRSPTPQRHRRTRMGRAQDVLAALASPFVMCAAVCLGGCSPLTAYNALAPADLGGHLATSDIAYGQDPRQRLDVYVPSAPVTAAPVAVVFYGGSWNSGRKEDYAFLGKALAARGIVTIVADYRLVPQVRFPAFLDDGASVVVWAHHNAQKFGGDPGRLFLVGHSAGAYNAVMIALDRRYLGHLGSSPAIIKGVAALAGPYDFLPLDVDSTLAAFGKASDLAATQPVNFVSREAPAMLLATGADDTTVYPRNSHQLADRLTRAGAKVIVRSYPGVGHVGILLALSVPFRGQAPVLDDVTRFVGGRAWSSPDTIGDIK